MMGIVNETETFHYKLHNISPNVHHVCDNSGHYCHGVKNTNVGAVVAVIIW